ncbi:MAG: hypothetical protein E5X76_28915 [Mesorhizobium sp.]|nr:MAG: hypothetical protein E5X76_28915 [Mesorhizobium sp.]
MSKPLPAFEVIALGEFVEHSRILAQWTDGPARFFVWLDAAGTAIAPDAFIHKNSVAPEWIGVGRERRKNPEAFPHRTVSQHAKAHAPIIAAIRVAIADGSLARAAVAAYTAEAEATEARGRAAHAGRLRAAIDGQADRLQLEASGQAAYHLREAAFYLSDDQLIHLAHIMDCARRPS